MRCPIARSVGDHEDELEQQKSTRANQKYEVLFKRDQESQIYRGFRGDRGERVGSTKTRQMMVSLLEAMSKDLAGKTTCHPATKCRVRLRSFFRGAAEGM